MARAHFSLLNRWLYYHSQFLQGANSNLFAANSFASNNSNSRTRLHNYYLVPQRQLVLIGLMFELPKCETIVGTTFWMLQAYLRYYFYPLLVWMYSDTSCKNRQARYFYLMLWALVTYTHDAFPGMKDKSWLLHALFTLNTVFECLHVCGLLQS